MGVIKATATRRHPPTPPGVRPARRVYEASVPLSDDPRPFISVSLRHMVEEIDRRLTPMKVGAYAVVGVRFYNFGEHYPTPPPFIPTARAMRSRDSVLYLYEDSRAAADLQTMLRRLDQKRRRLFEQRHPANAAQRAAARAAKKAARWRAKHDPPNPPTDETQARQDPPDRPSRRAVRQQAAARAAHAHAGAGGAGAPEARAVPDVQALPHDGE